LWLCCSTAIFSSSNVYCIIKQSKYHTVWPSLFECGLWCQ
jgi:hypothetical protein